LRISTEYRPPRNRPGGESDIVSALFRRAGLRWFDAFPLAYDAALRVAPGQHLDPFVLLRLFY
jgi:hypothetical protein